MATRRSTKVAAWILSGVCAFATSSAADAEEWASIGPFGAPLANNDVISGQMNAVAVDPRDANIIYVGASEGGVWKTRDGGATWAPLTDTQLVRKVFSGKSKGTLSIGSLAIDPVNPQIVYAGTGDPNVAADSLFGPALGVFRSSDGGSNWVPLGTNLSQAGCQNGAMSQIIVNRMLVVPGRRAVVFAATNFGLFRYRENGSDCWTRPTNGLPPFGNAIDLVVDPYQGALYVAYSSQGIFKSTNLSGAQWTMLAGGLPTSGFGRVALAFGGRTGIGFSQPLPLVYAGFNAGGVYRLFVTKDGGNTWSELPSPPSQGQLGFNNTIAVGPYNSDEVYIGQIAFWRATDGGRKGGANSYKVSPPIEDNSWTVLGCCLSEPNPFRKNLDLHGDLHDIQFAPYGSFLPSPSQIQIVFVASDGGITKGSFDSDGVVSWEPLTKGLAVGQSGTIGLDPGNQATTVSGFWHNGDILTFTQSGVSVPLAITGGDGFQTTIDAGSLTVYYNCNAGFDGKICRAIPPAPFFTSFKLEEIWTVNAAGSTLWSDPHRPGHLFRLQNGLLFRTTAANTAPASELNTADAWEAIDPFWGKTGVTTTMAFRSRVLEEQPVYYLGTSTGQVWRGSPEVGWTKLCECGASVNAIAPDLVQNERVYVALSGSSSPGRIKELSRLGGGTWATKTIDTAFTPELDVTSVTSIVVDPMVGGAQGTTVYVGTDQGMYRGHADAIVLDPSVSALIHRPPIFGDWAWRRSPGVPNVKVMDVEVHQNFQAHDRSGIIRAGTYGRGIFELRRISPKPPDQLPVTLSVQAVQRLEDGAPSYPSVRIPIVVEGKKTQGDTPFSLAPPKNGEVTLEAPRDIRVNGVELEFAGWVIAGQRSERAPKITLRVDEATQAIAYYEGEEEAANPKAKPPVAALKTSAERMCAQSLTHSLLLSWNVSDGSAPIIVRAEIAYPDKHIENIELKSSEGSQLFPMSFADGGNLAIKIVATDSSGASSSATSTVRLEPCAGAAQVPQ